MTFEDLKNSNNKDKVAIVAVGYNRIKSMTRLFNSLLAAEYPSNEIPLVISVDCSGDIVLYDYVKTFEWPYGPKYVNIQQERLGLKNHIFQCGDLTEYFKAIILLEDDIFVSPVFYSYTLQTLDKYANDKRIGQISLYRDESNGYVGLPFANMQNGNDVFLVQAVCSWGECWTAEMWNSFKEWRDTHSDEDVSKADIPAAIKGWTRAWSKYYHTYLVETDKYVVYPNVAVTTNFSDAGEHGEDNNALVQTNLLQNDFKYRLGDFEELVQYDIYYCNKATYEWLNLSKDELTLDYYGFNPNIRGCRYILSTKTLPYKVVKSIGLYMRPIELNVKYNIAGKGLYLYDTSESVNIGKVEYDTTVVPYFLRNFRPYLLFYYIKCYTISKIIRKFLRK